MSDTAVGKTGGNYFSAVSMRLEAKMTPRNTIKEL